MKAAASPEAFIQQLTGWQAEMIPPIRAALHAGAEFQEAIKWGNLVFLHGGPCALVRAEEKRVLLGFWRGKRLTGTEPRIRPSGRYELGNITLLAGDSIDPATVSRLASESAALNAELGDPTHLPANP